MQADGRGVPCSLQPQTAAVLGHQFVEQVQCASVRRDVVAVTVKKQRPCRSGARPGAGTESMTIA